MIKKIILNLLIVGVVVFVLDFAIGRTLRYFYFKETSGLHYRTTYAMETTEAEILIFGASRASHHYVPEVFEDSLKMSFYNTGRDGNGLLFQAAVLKSVLTRYTPKIIILDFAGDFEKENNDYDRLSSLLPYCKNHKEIRNIINLKSRFERIKMISEIYPFNSEPLTIAIGNLEINKTRKRDHKGYVALYKEWPDKIDSVKNNSNIQIDTNKLYFFREFIKTAKNAGAKVFVVYSPVFYRMGKNIEIELCNKICAEEKVPFWDYSKDTVFLNNNRFFQDVVHMNDNGAVKFSSNLVKKLKGYLLNKEENIGF